MANTLPTGQPLNAVCGSPGLSCRHVAVAGREVRIVDVAAMRIQTPPKHSASSFVDVVWTEIIAAATTSGRICVYSAFLAEIRTIQAHKRCCNRIAAADHLLLSASQDGAICNNTGNWNNLTP